MGIGALLAGFGQGIGQSVLDRHEREHQEQRQQMQLQIQYAQMIANDPHATDEGHQFALSTLGTLLGEKDPTVLHQAFEALKNRAGVRPQSGEPELHLPGSIDRSSIQFGLNPEGSHMGDIPSLSMQARTNPGYDHQAKPRQGIFYSDEEIRQRHLNDLEGDEAARYRARAPYQIDKIGTGVDAKGNVVGLGIDGMGRGIQTPFPGVNPTPAKNISHDSRLYEARSRVGTPQFTPADAALIKDEQAKQDNVKARTALTNIRITEAPKEMEFKGRRVAVGERNAATGEKNAETGRMNAETGMANSDNTSDRYSGNLRVQRDRQVEEGDRWDAMADSINGDTPAEVEQRDYYRAKAAEAYGVATRLSNQAMSADQNSTNRREGAAVRSGRKSGGTSPMPAKKSSRAGGMSRDAQDLYNTVVGMGPQVIDGKQVTAEEAARMAVERRYGVKH